MRMHAPTHPAIRTWRDTRLLSPTFQDKWRNMHPQSTGPKEVVVEGESGPVKVAKKPQKARRWWWSDSSMRMPTPMWFGVACGS